jgi:2-polyprenyl-3-methyl-5-hydroxy-6-metoxy-1,4-benzoquinol methylase
MTPFATTIYKEIPDSKFIILIRNPWDYVRSGMRRNYYFGHPWDSGRLCPEVHHQDYERWQKMDQFEKVCWLWNETYLRISKYLEQIPSDNYIVVKFEDLIANAEKSREIFKFLNLKKFRKNVIDSILSKKANEQTNGSFPKPEEWTFQQHQTLIKECGETIKKYGYESYKEKYVDNKIQTGKTIIKPVNYMTPDNKSIIKTEKYVIQEEGEKSSEWYDASFENADHWKYHYSLSNYYFLWAVISDRIVRAGIDSVLEIGCGPGQLACLIRDKGVKKYHGFDFSPKRIEQANKACPEFTFSQQDAFKTDLFTTCDYRSVICTEFLEHVKGDLEVLKRIRSGTKFYGTVPNFPYTSHVRHFRDGHDVLARYEQCFEELHVDTFLANNRSVIYYLLEGIIIEK